MPSSPTPSVLATTAAHRLEVIQRLSSYLDSQPWYVEGISQVIASLARTEEERVAARSELLFHLAVAPGTASASPRSWQIWPRRRTSCGERMHPPDAGRRAAADRLSARRGMTAGEWLALLPELAAPLRGRLGRA
jgi:hypothetical protein